MVRFYEKQTTYDSSWEDVTSAFWIKYPNARAKHVRSVDTVARHVSVHQEPSEAANAAPGEMEDVRRLKLRRVMHLSWDVPAWIEKIFNLSMNGLAVEDSVVTIREPIIPRPALTDVAEATAAQKKQTAGRAVSKVLEMYGRNISLARFLLVSEYCRYEPHPDDPKNKTLYTTKLEARVTMPGFKPDPEPVVNPLGAGSSSSASKKGIEDSSSSSSGSSSKSSGWGLTSGFGVQGLVEASFIKNAEKNAAAGWESMASRIEESKSLFPAREWEQLLGDMVEEQQKKARAVVEEHKRTLEANFERMKSGVTAVGEEVAFEVESGLQRMKSRAAVVGDEAVSRVKSCAAEVEATASDAAKRVASVRGAVAGVVEAQTQDLGNANASSGQLAGAGAASATVVSPSPPTTPTPTPAAPTALAGWKSSVTSFLGRMLHVRVV